MGTTRVNEYGQPIGEPLPDWTPPPPPPRVRLVGRYCELRPLEPSTADGLWEAFSLDPDAREWTYLPYGPFPDREAFRQWVEEWSTTNDPLLYSIHPEPDAQPEGLAAYLRIMPASGSIEVGHLRFSRRLARTRAATEAMYLMMRQAFSLGYRRYEWKCDVFNQPSRRAALRLGFTFEGIFRQATVYKGRSRDTAWFSIIDTEWPDRARAFEAWLAADNFDSRGVQQRSLSDFMTHRIGSARE
ncbi:MAG: GNAT family protein [Acidobacteriota bacterium]|jgi:RimJ/RimL family protein N-acetyltransferase|nr:MAG: GNAT family N-acetyltransferase [Acidobacteriota bacterium]